MNEPTRVKADIVRYSPEYSSTIRTWIDSEETYHNLCRGKGFPPPEDVVDGWQRDGIASYVLFAGNKAVAYGELWDKPREMAMEVAHLLVDPLRRSEGYGTKMLNLLFERASQRRSVSQVLINLYSGDEKALGCYLKAGFELVGTTPLTMGLRMVRVAR